MLKNVYQGQEWVVNPQHDLVVQAPGDLTPSSGLLRHQIHMWCTDKYADETPIHIIKCFLKCIPQLKMVVHTSNASTWEAAAGSLRPEWTY